MILSYQCLDVCKLCSCVSDCVSRLEMFMCGRERFTWEETSERTCGQKGICCKLTNESQIVRFFFSKTFWSMFFFLCVFNHFVFFLFRISVCLYLFVSECLRCGR